MLQSCKLGVCRGAERKLKIQSPGSEVSKWGPQVPVPLVHGYVTSGTFLDIQ